MKSAHWREIAELIGVAAIVASLIFVGLELQQQQRIAQNESGFNLVENIRQVGNSHIENVNIWVRGNAGEELNPEESVIYKELIHMQWAGAFWVATSQQSVGDNNNVAIHDFAGFLHRNPGARRVWESLIEEDQYYRELLIPEPIGVDVMNIIFADLQMLGN